MAALTRLTAKTRLALERYCKHRGITKTEAIERGIKLLINEAHNERHPAYSAFERLRPKLKMEASVKDTSLNEMRSTSAAMKRYLDAKYPD